jgi:hypothetical protein
VIRRSGPVVHWCLSEQFWHAVVSYAAAAHAATRVLQELQPPGGDLDLEHAAEDDKKMTGEVVAESILRRLATNEPSPRTGGLRSALGSLVERIRIAEVEAEAREIEASIKPQEEPSD